MSEDQVVAIYIADSLIPELSEAELDKPRNPAEWALLLARLYEGIAKWNPNNIRRATTCRVPGASRGRARQIQVQGASRGEGASQGIAQRTDQELGAMSEDQIVALYITNGYRELLDDYFKDSYLPAHIAISQFNASEPRCIAAKQGLFSLFVQLLPALQAAMMAELRTARYVAALRAIEAIRLYAAAHDGDCPSRRIRSPRSPCPTTRRPASRWNTAATATPRPSPARTPACRPLGRRTGSRSGTEAAMHRR